MEKKDLQLVVFSTKAQTVWFYFCLSIFIYIYILRCISVRITFTNICYLSAHLLVSEALCKVQLTT